jgi:Peptidase family S41
MSKGTAGLFGRNRITDWCRVALWVWLLGTQVHCATSKLRYNPDKKYGAAELREDFNILRGALHANHPSLYWYTPKDTLDLYFDRAYGMIRDSLNEIQFRNIVSYAVSKVNCGHTSVRYSKRFNNFYNSGRLPQFPLSVKLWDDSAVVFNNANRRDSIIKRGAILKSINGMSLQQVRDTIFRHLSMDGYSINHKYQSLSNNFPAWHRQLFGLSKQYKVEIIDTNQVLQALTIPVYDPRADTLNRSAAITPLVRPGRKELKRRLLGGIRNLGIDTVKRYAIMTINSFSSGNKLRRFIRQSFKKLDRLGIQTLTIELRNNGGGNVGNSTLLTKYISDHKFKIADSLYAISRRSDYDKYISGRFVNRLFMLFFSKRRRDGLYHFGYFERHVFKPKQKHHFNGKVILLLGGDSFSATTLFAQAVKGQSNVTLVGEETGGGRYGNTAFLIPDITLPHSRLRVRLPHFRLVMNRNDVKDGRGLLPDILVKPSAKAIARRMDLKIEKVKELVGQQ